jgi:hypothetical protein
LAHMVGSQWAMNSEGFVACDANSIVFGGHENFWLIPARLNTAIERTMMDP